MNINLNKSNGNYELFPLFHDEVSPYLSPLKGLDSPRSQLSQDDFLNFVLQERSLDYKQHQDLELQNSVQDQLHVQDEAMVMVRLQEQEKSQTKEPQTASFVGKSSQLKIQSIVRYLVSNDQLSQDELKLGGRCLYQHDQSLEYVFKSLMGKFKKLKKTKEEMTKFCIRKAFKFIHQMKRNQNKRNPDQKTSKEFEEESFQIQIPFKKNSSQKTMNNQYLRQLFSKRDFVNHYSQFLTHIHNLIQEDNDSKITYISNTIHSYIQNNQLKKIDGIKRLPWNQTILRRTEELAFSMMEFVQIEKSLNQSK